MQRYQDEVDRIPIEGKFGNAKGKGSLGKIMTKLRQTSESVIHVGIIVLNLQTWLRKGSVCLYFGALELLKSVPGYAICGTIYFDNSRVFCMYYTFYGSR